MTDQANGVVKADSGDQIGQVEAIQCGSTSHFIDLKLWDAAVGFAGPSVENEMHRLMRGRSAQPLIRARRILEHRFPRHKASVRHKADWHTGLKR